jgi:hypothetical protein
MPTDGQSTFLGPGQAAYLAPSGLEIVHSANAPNGLVVDPSGRLALTLGGAGIRAAFEEPQQLRALAFILLAVAEQMAAANASAAASADAELAAIVSAANSQKDNPRP